MEERKRKGDKTPVSAVISLQHVYPRLLTLDNTGGNADKKRVSAAFVYDAARCRSRQGAQSRAQPCESIILKTTNPGFPYVTRKSTNVETPNKKPKQDIMLE